jgi:AraC-like DNA-binding protein
MRGEHITRPTIFLDTSSQEKYTYLMTYARYVPSPPLNAYINGIYYLDHPMPYPRQKILPIPWLNLKVNFGGAFRVYDMNRTQPFAACTESWSVGLWNGYHIIDWPVEMQFFIVDFKPGGAFPFLQLPLSEMHNQVVSLDTIWGHFATEIRERLYAAPTLQAQFILLERLLLDRFCPVSHGLNEVQYAIQQIATHHGALSIRALSDEIGISQKQLIAHFKRLVGGTPKELARLYRFHHALETIDPMQPVDWALVAHQCCYYDQSHFNKDFEAFAGHTPSEYLRLRRRVYGENPEHAQNLLLLPAS